eukprot:2576986-Lingulodinium_polyedra.AAC.1
MDSHCARTALAHLGRAALPHHSSRGQLGHSASGRTVLRPLALPAESGGIGPQAPWICLR